MKFSKKEQHEAFLKKMGYDKNKKSEYKVPFPNLKEGVSTSDSKSIYETIQPMINKKTIIDQARNESKEVKEEILRKATRTAPLFNKGGYQYISDGDDIKTLGRKI